MLTAYLFFAAWFYLADMLAGEIAESPYRPVGSIVLALLWPLSQAFALVASAAIIKRYRDRIAALEKERAE